MAEISARPVPKVPALRGITVATLFFEDSTRTRLSFETAAKRLSADTMTFSVGTSSVNKGESLRDTVETIAAMGVDAFVVRHKSSGRAVAGQRVDDRGGDQRRRRMAPAPDAGAARRLHDPRRVRVASRAGGSRWSATSATAGWRAATSTCSPSSAPSVTLVAPPTLLPPSLEGWPVEVAPTLDEVIGDLDVLYLLRMQRERTTEALVPTLREYTDRFGLTPQRAARLPEHAIVLHPGPMNRGVEMAVDPDRAARAR